MSAPSPADTETLSETPLTAAEEEDIRGQIERNWNLSGSLLSSPNLDEMVVKLRLDLLPDGTVVRIESLNEQPDNPDFQKMTESAMRAVKISSPLKLPPGNTFNYIVVTFRPGEIVQ